MLNIIFTGEFTYPEGMAGTKRIQHYIDYLSQNNIIKIFLIGQNSQNTKALKVIGKKGNTEFIIIGSGLNLLLKIFYELPISTIYAFINLLKWKKRETKNILYVYNGITIENIAIIMFSKIIGYRIVVEYVEDLRQNAGNIPKGIYLKNKSNVFFERFIPLFTHGVVVISNYLFLKYSNYSNKVPIIHIPITAYINKNSTSKFLSKSSIKIVYSGSFGSKDGIETLISAFLSFEKEYPNSQLYLSGTNKNTKLIQQFLIHPKITYIGYLPDNKFYPFIANADILCIIRNNMPYANAGFPFKLGEYLATGKPVITSSVSDINLYLENYKDAIIVEPEKPEQIVNAFNFLINNPKRANEIGKNGQMKCCVYFNPKKNSQKLLNFLLEI